MENVFLKFPHLGEMIFDNIDVHCFKQTFQKRKVTSNSGELIYSNHPDCLLKMLQGYVMSMWGTLINCCGFCCGM